MESNTGQYLQSGNNYSIKKNCAACGVFISKSGIPTLKEPYCNFEADMFPQENYQNLLEDEHQLSFYHFYQSQLKELSDQERHDLNKLRSVNIERIFYFGEKLRQSFQTIYLACAYFDLLLFRQFMKDNLKQTNVIKIQQNDTQTSVERSKPNILNEELFIICQTPVNEKVRDKGLNLKAQMCLLLASKFDELDDFIPMIRDFQKLSRYEFAYVECKLEEEAVLRQLGWSLNFITPYHIIDSLIQQGVIFEDDKIRSEIKSDNRMYPFTQEKLRIIRKKSEFFCKLAVISNFEMQRYQPSYTAFSCILAARLACQVVPWWNEKLIELTNMNIHANKQLRECFDNLYMTYDDTYIPQSSQFGKNHLKLKSTISICDANTLDNTQINAKKSKVLEQNQNITNDSFIDQSANKNVKDQDTQPRHAENQFNYDIGEDSILSKRQIDNLPESHIANRQSQINLNLHQVGHSLSNRTSFTNLNSNKFKNSENYISDGSMTVNNFLVSKRKSDLASFNKENQGQTTSVRSLIQTAHLESKSGRFHQQSTSLLPKDENRESQMKSNNSNFEQSRTFNSSQIFQVPIPRCSTIISHTHNNHQESNRQQQYKLENSGTVQDYKQRNQSVSDLNQQQNYKSAKNDQNQQHQLILQKLGNVSNKINQDIIKKPKDKPKQSQNQVKNIKIGSSHQDNKGQKSRKLSTCSNTSLNKLQSNGSLTRKNTNLSLLNQRNTSTNEYMACKPIQSKLPKSSRNSTSIGLHDTASKEASQQNDKEYKLKELKQKYYTENPIYEKQMLTQLQANNQGRNLQQSMLSGFHAHSKTYAVLNPSNFLNKKSISRERSISECELYTNPYGNQFTQKQLANNTKLPHINTEFTHQTLDNEYKQVKNTIVIEEDFEGDKTQNDLSVTQVYAEELIPADEDSIVIKKPMSSRKSKSIENVNKFISMKRKSTSNNSNKGIIDIYKRQYNIQIEKVAEHTRNMLPQSSTRIATIDLQNVSRPPSKNKTNYIKRNITNVTTVNCQLQSSIDNNTSIESQKETMITYRDNYNLNAKRNSRQFNQLPKAIATNVSQDKKTKLSSKLVKQSFSKRRVSESKHQNLGTFNQTQNHQQTIAQQQLSHFRKSTQQNTIRLLLNHKSQANIIEQRKSVEPKIQDNKILKDSAISSKITNKVKKESSNSINLSACSSQVQLKERPFQKFINPESKQLFTAFSKNFKNPKKSPTPTQSQKINLDQFKIKVISPDVQAVENKNFKLLNALKSQHKVMNHNFKLNTSRQASNNSTSCDIVHPQLSHRSGNNSARQFDQGKIANSINLVKFQKFQAKQPIKEKNHSLIERALMKKSQITKILKPYQSTNKVAQTLDNTIESNCDEKQNYNNNFTFHMQGKNQSVNSSTLMLPVLTHQLQAPGKNVRVSHNKNPSQLVQTSSHSLNPQDIPPPSHGKINKLSIASCNISLNQSQGNHIPLNTVTSKPPLLTNSSTTHSLHPQKLHKNPELRAVQLSTKHNNSNASNLSNSRLPYIQPPISARVSNKYSNNLNLCATDKTSKEQQDEFKKLTQQFKQQISKITNNS